MKKETHDIPEWAVFYLAYGECDGLTEDELDMLTAFIEFNFPLGYTMEVQWDNFLTLSLFCAIIWRRMKINELRRING